MIVVFSSPDFNLDYPASQGGGKVVTHYDITVAAPGQNPLTQSYATERVSRNLLTPAGMEYTVELPVFSPSINNKDVQVYVREVRGDGGVGAYGGGSATFYGGQPALGACNVVSVL